MRVFSGCFSTPAIISLLLLGGCMVQASPAEPLPPLPDENLTHIGEEAPPAELATTPEDALTAMSAECFGALKQGGLVICPAQPGSVVQFGNVAITADETSTAQYGLTRTALTQLNVLHGGELSVLPIETRQDELRVVQGFDCDRIDARTAAQKAHAARSWETKQAGFASFNPGRGALEGFIVPADAPPSSPFGPTRKYVGVSKTSGEPCESLSVHQGYDLATPVGTPVYAPAAGVVTLADPDLYYEGGTVFLDHGHGLLSVFMHLSAVDVAAGDRVERGAVIAKTGNTGRTTGPHLHWAVKWRNPGTADRGGDYYIDPALLLDLPLND